MNLSHLSRRGAQMSPGGNMRTQKHGTKKVGAADIQFAAVALDAITFAGFMEDPDAHECFFRQEESGLWRPRFRTVKSLYIDTVFLARVNLYLGPRGKKLPLEGKIDGMRADFQDGGATHLSFKFKGPRKPSEVASLFENLDHELDIEIEEAREVDDSAEVPERDENQQELPLRTDEPPVPLDLDEEPPEEGRFPVSQEEADEGHEPDTRFPMGDARRMAAQVAGEGESGIGGHIRHSEAKKRRSARARGEAR